MFHKVHNGMYIHDPWVVQQYVQQCVHSMIYRLYKGSEGVHIPLPMNCTMVFESYGSQTIQRCIMHIFLDTLSESFSSVTHKCLGDNIEIYSSALELQWTTCSRYHIYTRQICPPSLIVALPPTTLQNASKNMLPPPESNLLHCLHQLHIIRSYREVAARRLIVKNTIEPMGVSTEGFMLGNYSEVQCYLCYSGQPQEGQTTG